VRRAQATCVAKGDELGECAHGRQQEEARQEGPRRMGGSKRRQGRKGRDKGGLLAAWLLLLTAPIPVVGGPRVGGAVGRGPALARRRCSGHVHPVATHRAVGQHRNADKDSNLQQIFPVYKWEAHDSAASEEREDVSRGYEFDHRRRAPEVDQVTRWRSGCALHDAADDQPSSSRRRRVCMTR
jgi:hypothetical protein